MKVKYFEAFRPAGSDINQPSGTYVPLDTQINDFIKSRLIKVLDIKFSSSCADNNEILSSALLMYEEFSDGV